MIVSLLKIILMMIIVVVLLLVSLLCILYLTDDIPGGIDNVDKE